MRVDLGAGKIIPRWVVAFFVGCAVVLIPWIALMFTVPQDVNVGKHGVLVWGGFDCFLVLGFAVTAFRLITRSPHGAVTAAMTGTMLLIDAWFDVLTTHRGGVWVSILMAVFAEIPCAVICFAVSRRIVKLFEQAKLHLGEAGFTVQNGRLVAPAGFPGSGTYAAPATVLATAAFESAATPAAPTVTAQAPVMSEPGSARVEAADPGRTGRAASERGLGAPVIQQGLLAEPL
jgi:hypothetical protein